jgi:hypothetical protein
MKMGAGFAARTPQTDGVIRTPRTSHTGRKGQEGR